MMNFADHPAESDFRKIEADMAALGTFNQTDTDQHMLLLSAGFLAGGHEGHGWVVSGKSDTGKAALEIISGKGKVGAWAGDDKAIDDSKLDYWWMEYLGSQAEKYLVKILKYAGDPRHYSDQRALWVSLASWSFKSNCKQIKAVREFAQRCLTDPVYKDRQAFLRECVE
jgi:hypothetical protein